MGIIVTERAMAEVKKVMAEQNMNETEFLLDIGVAGGGCSGFSYRLGFRNRSDVDPAASTVSNFHGVDAVVDNKYLPYIEGATIDFHEGLDQRGFVFDNPMAVRSCGCNKSFSVSDEATPTPSGGCGGCCGS